MASNADAVRYRYARVADAPSIASLHADSWRRAYRGMLPDTYLDNDVFADRAAVWHERFNNPNDRVVTLTILAEQNAQLAGFVHSIVDEDSEFGTLLDNLHVRRQAQRLGIGSRLMAETASWLAESGSSSGIYLWVLEANAPARRFYEALGGQPAGRGLSDGTAGSSEPSLRMWWPQLDRLSRYLPAERRPI